MAGIKSKIPEIKREISSFLVGEEGKISKQHILTIGAFLALSAFFTKETASTHTPAGGGLSGSWNAGTKTVSGSHTHHASHSSHSSHSSY